jgi:co-chaperonin GroES (HSP10)
MQTLNGNILCKDTDETIKKSSVLILNELDNKYKTLKVISPDDTGICKEGEVIYVPFRSSTEVELEGVKYEIVNKRDIMFIV